MDIYEELYKALKNKDWEKYVYLLNEINKRAKRNESL